MKKITYQKNPNKQTHRKMRKNTSKEIQNLKGHYQNLDLWSFKQKKRNLNKQNGLRMKCAIYIYSIILSNFHSPTSSTISSFSTLAMIQLQTHSSSITSYEKRFELTLESSDKIMQLIERILGERKFKKREEERKNTDGHLENG